MQNTFEFYQKRLSKVSEQHLISLQSLFMYSNTNKKQNNAPGVGLSRSSRAP